MTPKLYRIKDFQKDTEIQGFFLVREKHRRTTRTDRPYLQLVLQDGTGSIEAKVWENVPAFEKSFQEGDSVAVRARVSEFNERLQIEVIDIGVASTEKHAAYGFDPMDLLPSTPEDVDVMWSELQQMMHTMESEPLRKLVTTLYEANAEVIRTHPASMVLHHAVFGGFLEHIHSMAVLGKHLAAHYHLDADLLLTGILLHDIGKVRELRPVSHPGYTDAGQLIGHIVQGYEMVMETIDAQPDFPPDLRLKIGHMILAHQGRYEWQSPKRPKFPEALLLHYLDELDARMNMMREIMDKDPESGSWTNRFNYYRLPILKGDLDLDAADSD